MPDDCQKYTCCGDEAYTYDIQRATPNPPPVELYQLILDFDSDEGTATGAGYYAKGSYVTIEANPNTGFNFTGWSGDFEGSQPAAQIYMDGNKTITANFTIQTFYVTLSVSPEESGTATGAGPYDYGDTASVSATPNAGVNFTGWTGDITGPSSSQSVTVTRNISATANFEPIYYPVTSSVYPTDSGDVTGDNSYRSGSTATLTAFPNEGYNFSHWEGDISSSDNPVSFPVNGNIDAVAVFTPKQFTVTTSVALTPESEEPVGTYGAVNGGGTYFHGSTVQLEAHATLGTGPSSEFAYWSGDITGTTNPYTFTITKDMNVIAFFDYPTD